MARSVGIPYYANEGKGDFVCLVWFGSDGSPDKGVQNGDGSITLEDGTVIMRRPHPQATTRNHVEYASNALAVPGCDVAEQMAEDRRHTGKNAPDRYDANGRPVWVGDGISVRRRKRGYMRAFGLYNKDDYA